MWGNRLGWTISLFIMAAAAALLWAVGHSARSAGTAFARDPHNFEPLALPSPPLVPGTTAPTAAGPTYRAAIESFERDRALYENFAAAGTLKYGRLEELAAVEVLVGASELAQAEVFASHPQEVVNYAHTKPAIEALRTLGRVMVDRLALMYARDPKNRELAERYARAGAVLGDALCRERLTYEEFALGQELLGKSAFVLARLADDRKDAAAASAWRDFDARRVAFAREQIEPTLAFVRSIDARVVGTRIGDVFELAKRSKERMWRVEAVMALGRARYFIGTSESGAADQRAALATVSELAERDPDPIVRAAAQAARDLTIEQHRTQ